MLTKRGPAEPEPLLIGTAQNGNPMFLMLPETHPGTYQPSPELESEHNITET